MSRKEPTLPPSERGLSGEKPPPPPAPPPARCLHGCISLCQECARSTVPIGHSAPVPPPTVQPGTILFAAPSPSIRDLLTCPFCGVVPLSSYAPVMSTVLCNNDACPANPSIDVREGDQPEGSTTAAECRRLWNHRPAIEVELERHGLNPNLFTEPKP